MLVRGRAQRWCALRGRDPPRRGGDMRVRAATSAGVTMLAVAGLALVSCSVPSGSDARPVDSDIAALLTPSVTPTPEPTARQRPSRITWVKKDKLVQRFRLIPAKTRQDRLD